MSGLLPKRGSLFVCCCFCAGHDLFGTIPIDHGRLPVKSAPRASSCWFQAPGALDALPPLVYPALRPQSQKTKKKGLITVLNTGRSPNLIGLEPVTSGKLPSWRRA